MVTAAPLLLLLCAASNTEPCRRGYKVNGRDATKGHSRRLDTCHTLCLGEGGCKGWDWSVLSKECSLYGSVDGYSESGEHVAGEEDCSLATSYAMCSVTGPKPAEVRHRNTAEEGNIIALINNTHASVAWGRTRTTERINMLEHQFCEGGEVRYCTADDTHHNIYETRKIGGLNTTCTVTGWRTAPQGGCSLSDLTAAFTAGKLTCPDADEQRTPPLSYCAYSLEGHTCEAVSCLQNSTWFPVQPVCTPSLCHTSLLQGTDLVIPCNTTLAIGETCEAIKPGHTCDVVVCQVTGWSGLPVCHQLVAQEVPLCEIDTQYNSIREGNENLEETYREATGADACSALCKDEVGCTCFTWNGNNERCWLMTSCEEPTIRPRSFRVVSGQAGCKMPEDSKTHSDEDEDEQEEETEHDCRVFPDKLDKGLEVVRGADWAYQNEDGRGSGTVIERSAECPGGYWVMVYWKETDTKGSYKAGCDGQYDLALAGCHHTALTAVTRGQGRGRGGGRSRKSYYDCNVQVAGHNNHVSTTSLDGCKESCSEYDQCVGVTYKESNNTCMLYDAIYEDSGSTQDTDRESCLRVPHPRCHVTSEVVKQGLEVIREDPATAGVIKGTILKKAKPCRGGGWYKIQWDNGLVDHHMIGCGKHKNTPTLQYECQPDAPKESAPFVCFNDSSAAEEEAAVLLQFNPISLTKCQSHCKEISACIAFSYKDKHCALLKALSVPQECKGSLHCTKQEAWDTPQQVEITPTYSCTKHVALKGDTKGASFTGLTIAECEKKCTQVSSCLGIVYKRKTRTVTCRLLDYIIKEVSVPKSEDATSCTRKAETGDVATDRFTCKHGDVQGEVISSTKGTASASKCAEECFGVAYCGAVRYKARTATCDFLRTYKPSATSTTQVIHCLLKGAEYSREVQALSIQPTDDYDCQEDSNLEGGDLYRVIDVDDIDTCKLHCERTASCVGFVHRGACPAPPGSKPRPRPARARCHTCDIKVFASSFVSDEVWRASTACKRLTRETRGAPGIKKSVLVEVRMMVSPAELKGHEEALLVDLERAVFLSVAPDTLSILACRDPGTPLDITDDSCGGGVGAVGVSVYSLITFEIVQPADSISDGQTFTEFRSMVETRIAASIAKPDSDISRKYEALEVEVKVRAKAIEDPLFDWQRKSRYSSPDCEYNKDITADDKILEVQKVESVELCRNYCPLVAGCVAVSYNDMQYCRLYRAVEEVHGVDPNTNTVLCIGKIVPDSNMRLSINIELPVDVQTLSDLKEPLMSGMATSLGISQDYMDISIISSTGLLSRTYNTLETQGTAVRVMAQAEKLEPQQVHEVVLARAVELVHAAAKDYTCLPRRSFSAEKLLTMKNVLTSTECIRTCDMTSACQTATYFQSDKSCVLGKQGTSVRDSDAAVGCEVTFDETDAEATHYACTQGATFMGGDLLGFEAGSIEACKSACDSLPKCNLVTYNNNTNICRLKKYSEALLAGTDGKDMSCRLLSNNTQHAGYSCQKGADFDGSQLFVVNDVSSTKSCATYCSKVVECTAVKWNAVEKLCVVFRDVIQGGEQKSGVESCSKLKREVAKLTGEKFTCTEGQKGHGSELASLTVDNWDDALSACSATPFCKAVSCHHTSCNLIGVLDSISTTPGHVLCIDPTNSDDATSVNAVLGDLPLAYNRKVYSCEEGSLNGGDIRMTSAPSLAACQYSCNADTACNKISYTAASSWCLLKDSSAVLAQAEDVISCMLTDSYYCEEDKRHLEYEQGAFQISLAECKEKCDSTPSCKSLTYDNSCHLAREGEMQGTAPGSLVCYPATPYSCMTSTKHYVKGAFVWEGPLLSLRECQIKCDATPTCVRAVYVPTTNDCTLLGISGKWAASDLAEPHVTCSKGMSYSCEEERDWEGAPIVTLSDVDTIVECQENCDTTPDCMLVVYDGLAQTCKLLERGTPASRAQEHKSLQSCVRSYKQVSMYACRTSAKYEGNILAVHHTASMEQCQGMCGKAANCTGVSFFKEICTLHRSTRAFLESSEHDSFACERTLALENDPAPYTCGDNGLGRGAAEDLLGVLYHAATSEACKSFCDILPSCTCYNYLWSGDHVRCMFYPSCTKGSDKQTCAKAKRTQKSFTPRDDLRKTLNCTANPSPTKWKLLYSVIDVDTVQACTTKCAQVTNCKYIEWKDHDKECILLGTGKGYIVKSTSLGCEVLPDVTRAIRRTKTFKCSTDLSLLGNRFIVASHSTKESCKARCEESFTCSAIHYSQDDKTCTLFGTSVLMMSKALSRKIKVYREVPAGVACVVVTPGKELQEEFVCAKGKGHIGGDMLSMLKVPFAKCKSLCTVIPQCIGLTYEGNKQCSLRTTGAVMSARLTTVACNRDHSLYSGQLRSAFTCTSSLSFSGKTLITVAGITSPADCSLLCSSYSYAIIPMLCTASSHYKANDTCVLFKGKVTGRYMPHTKQKIMSCKRDGDTDGQAKPTMEEIIRSTTVTYKCDKGKTEAPVYGSELFVIENINDVKTCQLQCYNTKGCIALVYEQKDTTCLLLDSVPVPAATTKLEESKETCWEEVGSVRGCECSNSCSGVCDITPSRDCTLETLWMECDIVRKSRMATFLSAKTSVVTVIVTMKQPGLSAAVFEGVQFPSDDSGSSGFLISLDVRVPDGVSHATFSRDVLKRLKEIHESSTILPGALDASLHALGLKPWAETRWSLREKERAVYYSSNEEDSAPFDDVTSSGPRRALLQLDEGGQPQLDVERRNERIKGILNLLAAGDTNPCTAGWADADYGVMSNRYNLETQWYLKGTLAECIEACKVRDECVAFSRVYGEDMANSACYFKRRLLPIIGSQVTFSGYRTYIYKCPEQGLTCDFAEHEDAELEAADQFRSEEISVLQMKITSSSVCKAACVMMWDCKGTTYFEATRQCHFIQEPADHVTTAQGATSFICSQRVATTPQPTPAPTLLKTSLLERWQAVIYNEFDANVTDVSDGAVTPTLTLPVQDMVVRYTTENVTEQHALHLTYENTDVSSFFNKDDRFGASYLAELLSQMATELGVLPTDIELKELCRADVAGKPLDCYYANGTAISSARTAQFLQAQAASVFIDLDINIKKEEVLQTATLPSGKTLSIGPEELFPPGSRILDDSGNVQGTADSMGRVTRTPQAQEVFSKYTSSVDLPLSPALATSMLSEKKKYTSQGLISFVESHATQWVNGNHLGTVCHKGVNGSTVACNGSPECTIVGDCSSNGFPQGFKGACTCTCLPAYAGAKCDACAEGFTGFPYCTPEGIRSPVDIPKWMHHVEKWDDSNMYQTFHLVVSDAPDMLMRRLYSFTTELRRALGDMARMVWMLHLCKTELCNGTCPEVRVDSWNDDLFAHCAVLYPVEYGNETVSESSDRSRAHALSVQKTLVELDVEYDTAPPAVQDIVAALLQVPAVVSVVSITQPGKRMSPHNEREQQAPYATHEAIIDTNNGSKLFDWWFVFPATAFAILAIVVALFVILRVIRKRDDGARSQLIMMKHEVFIEKKTAEPMGLVWEDHTLLKSVTVNSPAEHADAQRFIGRRAVRVNGINVETLRGIKEAAGNSVLVHIEFERQGPCLAIKLVGNAMGVDEKWFIKTLVCEADLDEADITVVGILEPDLLASTSKAVYLVLFRVNGWLQFQADGFIQRCRDLEDPIHNTMHISGISYARLDDIRIARNKYGDEDDCLEPLNLWVACSWAKKEQVASCHGVYTRHDVLHNGYPVWERDRREEDNYDRLCYRTKTGLWAVCSTHEEMSQNIGYLVSGKTLQGPHLGRNEWEDYDGGGSTDYSVTANPVVIRGYCLGDTVRVTTNTPWKGIVRGQGKKEATVKVKMCDGSNITTHKDNVDITNGPFVNVRNEDAEWSTGQIVNISEDDTRVKVHVCLEPYEAAKWYNKNSEDLQLEKLDIAIGDTVELVEDVIPSEDTCMIHGEIGMVLQILSDGETSTPFGVKGPDGSVAWYSEEMLKPVDTASTAKPEGSVAWRSVLPQPEVKRRASKANLATMLVNNRIEHMHDPHTPTSSSQSSHLIDMSNDVDSTVL